MHLRSIGVLGIMLALLGASACASRSAIKPTTTSLSGSGTPQSQTPQPTYASTIIATLTPGPASADTTPWISATAPIITASSQQTLDQSLDMNPPPPNELMAVWKSAGVELSWAMPATVGVPHSYQDEILYYKIYRHSEGTQGIFLAQTAQLTYLDRSAIVGTKYYYTVSALHAGGVESLQAKEVSAP
jgi:hypothetical protein